MPSDSARMRRVIQEFDLSMLVGDTNRYERARPLPELPGLLPFEFITFHQDQRTGFTADPIVGLTGIADLVEYSTSVSLRSHPSMSHRPSAGGGGTQGSSRESREFREYLSREHHYRPPPRDFRNQGDREAYSESPHAAYQDSGGPSPSPAETRGTETRCTTTYANSHGTPYSSDQYSTMHTVSTSYGLATSVYRDTAKPLHKDRDQLMHDLGRLRVAPGSYRRTNGKLRNHPELAESCYKIEALFEHYWEEAECHHADINLRPADINSAQPKRTQEMRSQQPSLPYTEASPSKSRPSQNYAEPRRPSSYSGKPEVSSTNTYREPLSPYPRAEMRDRRGTYSYRYKPQGSSRREEKSRSSRSGRYSDNDDDDDPRNQNSPKAAPPSPVKEELPNHYATLGISPDASLAEITKAAKIQRIKVHPDKCKNAGILEAELKMVDERAAQVGYAAEVLLDPEQKADYDRDCRNARRRSARAR